MHMTSKIISCDKYQNQNGIFNEASEFQIAYHQRPQVPNWGHFQALRSNYMLQLHRTSSPMNMRI